GMIGRQLCWIFLVLFCFSTGAIGKEKAVSIVPSIDALSPKTRGDINQLLSRLSDEQVRQILIQQLEKNLPRANQSPEVSGISGQMYRLESFSVLFQQRITELGGYLPQFLPDMSHIAQTVSEETGMAGMLQIILTLAAIIALAFGVDRLFWRFSAAMRQRFDAAPAMQGWLRFSAAVVRISPEFLGIVVFTLVSGLLFAVSGISQKPGLRLVFIAIMMMVVLIRLITLLSRLVWSPHAAGLRLASVSDTTAAYLHRNLTRLAAYFVILYVFALFLLKLQAPVNMIILVILFFSIPFLAMTAQFLWNSRMMVSDHLRLTASDSNREVSWFRNQMASGWHILVMGYVVLVWLLGMGRLILYGPKTDQAFAISFMILPLYLILVRVGKWLVMETLGTIGKTPEEENTRYFAIAMGLVRIIIGFTLALWLMNIWGIDLPFVNPIVQASFRILVTLILAHVIWGKINRYIQRRMASMAPSPSENKEDTEEGEAIVLDRSFTLLPMLRKFLGTVLAVMVILIILSSMGVDIGPLMAGAGVVGLAIGFGAQKLVADVLSGIFYLVDDAFRVGEWIQAGSVSGTVESFTFRNIMLRHHRGALQIVPFSKLGAITNYMRGGIVVKFNLELPYDTNVDQVRKIIKKVGEAMQADTEFGPDIMQPIKSQGIKSVADSVMTIRVKFMGKPGKQFVIQREAFKRITENLAKKGIHYAHRRVIVELPPGFDKPAGTQAAGTETNAAATTDILKAGAAAALTRMMVEEEKQKELLAKKGADSSE
ncbi:MAG: mechanosensitive ion channel domain-containing protein, partial [Desulfatirhabdiaceae bacterium]